MKQLGSYYTRFYKQITATNNEATKNPAMIRKLDELFVDISVEVYR